MTELGCQLRSPSASGEPRPMGFSENTMSIFPHVNGNYVVTVEQLEHTRYDNCELPSTLKYTFKLDREIIHLNLTRKVDFRSNIPVYVIKRSSDEKYDFIKEKNEEIFGHYEDKNTGASITARCTGKKSFSHDITGKFHKNGEELYIQPLTDLHLSEVKRNPTVFHVTESQESHYKIHRGNVEPNFQNDYRIPDKVSEDLLFQPPKERINLLNEPHRKRRAANTNYYVDILMFIEYSVYKRFYSISKESTEDLKRKDTISRIKEYYAHIANGVDIRYKATTMLPFVLNINLAAITIQERSEDAWSELYKEGHTIDADRELTAFKDVMKSSSNVPRHDHAMLFSGYDLYTIVNRVKELGSTGLAYIDTLCRTDGASVSVVEEIGGFQSIRIAAHELGHSLSAEHDGYANDCSSKDRYIMASGPGDRTILNEYNPWSFSKCSVNYFISKVTSLLEDPDNCLARRENNDDSIPDVSNLVPGQLYTPDQICVDILGPQSYYCRGLKESITTADICTDLYCRDPEQSTSCIRYDGPRKIPCGNKKWCIDGQCTYDAAAPEEDESCMFGDQPGIAYQGQICEELIYNRNDACYQNNVRKTCCKSCQKINTGLQGCEYGDRIKGCKTIYCNEETITSSTGTVYNISYSCCGTCKTSKPVQTTQVPPVTTGCFDYTLSGGVTCEQYIQHNGPRVCYESSVERACCISCSRLKEVNEPGCEYGDYYHCSAKNATNPRYCTLYERVCCNTCKGVNSAKGMDTVNKTFVLLISLTVYFISFLQRR